MAKEKNTPSTGNDKAFMALLQEMVNAVEQIDNYTFTNELTPEMSQLGGKVAAEVAKSLKTSLTRKKAKIDIMALVETSQSSA